MLLLVMKLTVSRSRVIFQKPKLVPPYSTLRSTLLLAWSSPSLAGAPKGLIYHTVSQSPWPSQGPGQRRLCTAPLTALWKRRKAGQTLDQSLATQDQQRTLPWYFTRCRMPRPKTHISRFRLTGQGLCTHPCSCAWGLGERLPWAGYRPRGLHHNPVETGESSSLHCGIP